MTLEMTLEMTMKMTMKMIMKMLSEGMPKEMVIQNILQESGRTISNIDREMVNNNEAKKGGPLGLGIIDAIRGGVGSAFTDPMSAQNYAMNAMKGRMKQDEPTIREMFEKEFKQLPKLMKKSLTYDNGTEMAQHK